MLFGVDVSCVRPPIHEELDEFGSSRACKPTDRSEVRLESESLQTEPFTKRANVKARANCRTSSLGLIIGPDGSRCKWIGEKSLPHRRTDERVKDLLASEENLDSQVRLRWLHAVQCALSGANPVRIAPRHQVLSAGQRLSRRAADSAAASSWAAVCVASGSRPH